MQFPLVVRDEREMRQPPIIRVIFSQPDEAYNTRFGGINAGWDPDQEPLPKRSDFDHSATVRWRRHAECRFTTQVFGSALPRAGPFGSQSHFAALRHW